MKGMIALFIAFVVIGMVCAMGSRAVADVPLGQVYCTSCTTICFDVGDPCSGSDYCPNGSCACTGNPLSCKDAP